MSWINSDATKKQTSKDDLSFYHGFSKTPVEPNTSTGAAATTLANASTKGGHTVIGTEVWAEEIPWFGLVASRAAAITRLSGLTKLNDLVKVDGEGGKVYKYKGADDATFTEETWSDFWQEVTLTNGMTLNNRHNQPVLRYYLNQPMQTLTTTNNASIDSKGYATRLFVNESNHTGQTSGGSVVSQFAAGTDNIKNGIPSVELNPKLYLGTTEKIAGTHYYDYNVSGTILWSTAVTSSSPKISCFRYIGKTVTGQLATVDTTVKSHALDIANIKLALGMNSNPDSPTTSVTARVETVEDVVRVLLGLGDSDTIAATESIATTAANAVSTSLAGDTDGTIGKAIADAKQEALDAINAIQHFSVVVVPVGQTMENVTPVENTIYLVSDSQAADGSYIEYIAFKQGEETKVERIGTTKLDLDDYTTDAEHEALQGRVSTTEGQIATITSTDATKEGSIAKALADAKTYAEGQASAAKSGAETTAANALSAARTEITAEIAQAKSEAIASAEVTITAGTGIVVTGEGKGTTFEIAVSDDVATAAALSALSQTVASNKTELEGKITAAETAASTALETAKTEIKSTTDALDGRLQTAEGKVSTLEGQVATLTTGDNSVDSKIQTAVDAITETTDAISEAVDGVKATADTAVQTASGDTYVSAEKEADTTNIKITTNIEAITSAVDTALIAEGTAVATAIAAAATAGTDAADALADTAITEQSVSGSGISLTLGGKVSAPTLIGSVTPATYTSATKTWTNESNVAKASDIATAISDAVGAITIPSVTTSAAAQAVGVTASGHEVSVATANYIDAVGVGMWTDMNCLVTGSTVSTYVGVETAKTLEAAKSYSDSLHSTNLVYVVLGDSESLPAASADTLGKIYLVASQNAPTSDGSAISGAYVEYMTRKVGEGETATYTWEKIGTTEADLAAYAKTDDVISSIATAKSEAIAAAKTETTTQVNALAATHAIDKTALEGSISTINDSIAAMNADLTVNGINLKQVNGTVTELSESLITASVPAGTTSVEGNVAYAGSTKHVIAPEKFQTAAQMPSTLTSWVADLSNLTVGDNMFKGCTGLTVFVGDLSSLTSAVDMFNGCTLDEDSLEILSENLPTVSGGTIDIGASTNATAEMIAEIKGKGWTVKSNGTAL